MLEVHMKKRLELQVDLRGFLPTRVVTPRLPRPKNVRGLSESECKRV